MVENSTSKRPNIFARTCGGSRGPSMAAAGFAMMLPLQTIVSTANAATIVADDADDVCIPTADPCVITDTVQIVHRSVLDFGTRTLQLKNGGQLDFGWGESSVLCGGLTATLGTKPGIRLEASNSGAMATIIASRRCSGDTSVICETNFTCEALDAGTCSAGSGNVWLDAKVDGNASWPASLWIRAAGTVSFLKTVKISASSSTSDGGELVVEAFGGSITVSNNVTATGGSDGEGGYVLLAASDDVIVTSLVDVSGGLRDGGTIELIADRDVRVSNDLSADATSKDGFGGFIILDAGRDVSITGGSGSNRVVLSADGHNSSLEGIGGDGGELVLLAGRDVSVGQYGRLQTDGAIPDGFGGYVEIDAGNSVSLQGEIFARAKGSDGAAGLVGLFGGSILSLATTSKIDMTGGEAILVGAANDLVQVDGFVDLSASGANLRGATFFDSGGTLSVAGSVVNSGAGSLFVGIDTGLTGCWVTLANTGLIDTRGPDSSNEIVGREQTTIISGARLLADPVTGQNRIAYRAPSQPPVVSGTVQPSAVPSLETQLAPCQ